MLKRIIEQYVAPLAAAAGSAAGGATGATGAAGAAGAAEAGAAGEGKAAMDAAKSGGGGSIPNPGDVVGGGIRAAGRAASAPFNVLSAIPQSAGAAYRADLDRLHAERYAGKVKWTPAVAHNESGDVYSGKSFEHALREARKANLSHDPDGYTFGFTDQDGEFYSEAELDHMQGLSS